MNSSSRCSKQMRLLFAVLFLVSLISCLLVSETLANKGGEDIILYNGNIVMRGGKGKGKGKGGSIVIANSPMEQMPFDFGSWGGFGRRRK